MAETPEHSELSPSGSAGWMACAGRPNLVRWLGVKSGKTKYSIFGDECHDISAKGLRYLFHGGPLPKYPADGDGEHREVVEAYVVHVMEGSKQFPACAHKQYWMVWIETRFTLRLIHPSVWGTGDCIIYCPHCRWLRVIDLKSGSGHEVEAEWNPQLGIYGLLALYEWADKMGPVERITIEISQPRAPSGRTHKVWEPTVAELLGWLPEIQAKAVATDDPNAPLTPGDHCKSSFCPALGACPAWRGRLESLAVEGFRRPLPSAPTLDVRYLVDVLTWGPALIELVESAHAIAYAAAQAGTAIPGFKLVNKRDGNRRWTDAETAMKVLLAGGRNAVEVVCEPQKLRSPAQLEKVFGEEAINNLCSRAPGGTTLVPESDKRPAITGVDVNQVFEKRQISQTKATTNTQITNANEPKGKYLL